METTQIKSDPNVIDFGIGQPQLDLLPRDILARAAQELLNKPDNTVLNYGHPKGDGRFRAALAGFLSEEYGASQDPANLMASGGCSQALDMLARVFAQPGDTILVEEPTYFLSHQIFRDRGLKIVGVPTHLDGLDLDALEAAVRKHRPAFVYTIPVFQNPTGVTLSQSKRAQLLELARSHDFLVVADEVYQSLYYQDPPPAPLANSVDSGVVISLGSFSKILAPGLRLGWIQTHPELQSRLLKSGMLRSGGGVNHFAGCLVESVLRNGWQSEYLAHLKATYARRVGVMDQGLKGLPVTYRKPLGGYFFWVELEGDFDSAELSTPARGAGTGFREGIRFSTRGGFGNYLRLSFAHYDCAQIEQGLERLKGVLRR